MLKPVKGFLGVVVGTSLGSAAMEQVGSIGSGMSSGLKSATQSMVGIGILGNAVSVAKDLFKNKEKV